MTTGIGEIRSLFVFTPSNIGKQVLFSNVQEFGRQESTAATASDGITLRTGFP
jgi:hypothetical protein